MPPEPFSPAITLTRTMPLPSRAKIDAVRVALRNASWVHHRPGIVLVRNQIVVVWEGALDELGEDLHVVHPEEGLTLGGGHSELYGLVLDCR